MPGLVRRRVENRAAVRRAEDLGRRVEYLGFLLAGEKYGVRISLVAEILKPPPLTEVPRAPRYIRGIVSVRGRLVTVIDLRRRFRLSESPLDGRTRILLVDRGDEQVGLWVDEVLQVYRLADNEIEPPSVLGGDQPPYVLGIGRSAGDLLLLLDLRAVLET
ncbi:MAG TPA: chemotaxis protein CheW [Polyangiaceae bacterium]